MTGQKQLDENRRAGLEAYLTSAVQGVINASAGLEILAQFLDDDYHNLRIKSTSRLP
jgi:hypothetical protein